jgi:hypothetical protein
MTEGEEDGGAGAGEEGAEDEEEGDRGVGVVEEVVEEGEADDEPFRV